MKFSEVITNGGSDAPAKGHEQKLKVKVTEVKTQYSRFRTVQLLFEFTNEYEIMYEAWWRFGEVYYCFQCHLSYYKVTRMKNHQFWRELNVSGL